mmetsp:Transcript_22597/g.72714  ORF Transcript_22597/g.72714 Transcript_22597/m.72714 type:complete len:265 (+) Transcript_22597:530-1324(+)
MAVLCKQGPLRRRRGNANVPLRRRVARGPRELGVVDVRRVAPRQPAPLRAGLRGKRRPAARLEVGVLRADRRTSVAELEPLQQGHRVARRHGPPRRERRLLPRPRRLLYDRRHGPPSQVPGNLRQKSLRPRARGPLERPLLVRQGGALLREGRPVDPGRPRHVARPPLRLQGPVVPLAHPPPHRQKARLPRLPESAHELHLRRGHEGRLHPPPRHQRRRPRPPPTMPHLQIQQRPQLKGHHLQPHARPPLRTPHRRPRLRLPRP